MNQDKLVEYLEWKRKKLGGYCREISKKLDSEAFFDYLYYSAQKDACLEILEFIERANQHESSSV